MNRCYVIFEEKIPVVLRIMMYGFPERWKVLELFGEILMKLVKFHFSKS